MKHSFTRFAYALALSLSPFSSASTFQNADNATSTASLLPRQDYEYDGTDLSMYVNRMAAIGDSYSAGIGAGDRLGNNIDLSDSQSDSACGRFSHAYPMLLYGDPRWQNGQPRFQFRSCSGAVTADVLQKQIPALNSGQDAILLSVGGNDAELVAILNQCIYQFVTLNWEQVTLAEIMKKFDPDYAWLKKLDIESLGRGCAKQLERSGQIIASSDFDQKLDAVVNAAKAKLSGAGRIYWTGYAKFFAEDYSSACNSVSWTTWFHKIVNIWQPKVYLTVNNRRIMNGLVDQMNAKLRAAANRAGSNVIFVDYDKYVGYFGGRFCENGVDETPGKSNTRTRLMFYELDTSDWSGKSPWKRSESPSLNTTFGGNVNTLGLINLRIDPDSQYVVSKAGSPPSSRKIKRDYSIGQYMPDGYMRIFHPQILLHEIIAGLVAWNIINQGQTDDGYPALPEELSIDTCPLIESKPPAFYARILPLGASIVFGSGSSTGNGFRKPLRDSLRQAGWKVNMVGSKANGNMIDNNVEAKSGDRVDQIQTASGQSTKYKPNIVLINAGTNDCTQNYDLSNFGNRYNSLLDSLYQAIPGVTIIPSLVLPGNTNGIPQNRDNVNSQIRQIVSSRRGKGQKIVLADVDSPSGFLTTQYISSDGTHPNDEGHRRLAAIFRRAIEEASQAGFLSAPADSGYSDDPGKGKADNTCDKTYGSGQSAGPFNTQQGSGQDDGTYVHSSTSFGVRMTISTDANANFTFARLTHAFGLHDLVQINAIVSGKRQYSVWTAGYGSWSQTSRQFALEDGCIARGVRFVDVNGDGLDDMVCIGPSGNAYVSINRGSLNFASSQLWKESEGPLQDRVRLADIDGDGRTDYCTIADDGDIDCWRNGGQGDLAEYWQDLGTLFTGKGFGDIRGVRFADINGDGRDDWLWVDDTGRTWTYTNNRGCKKGTLQPTWRAGANAANDGAWTHGGLSRQVGRDSIRFVKAFGTADPLRISASSDYVYIEDTGLNPKLKNQHLYNISVWQNTGSGATKLKADGDRYCNMRGNRNGAMDYVWMHSSGVLTLYESLGGQFPSSPPYWGSNYQIWSAQDQVGAPINRRDLHLADWDGDGRCDIIHVDPLSGGVEVWLNKGISQSNPNNWARIPFDSSGIAWGSSNQNNKGCTELRGVGIFDYTVRFADIDGDKRADYLCIEKDGRTWGYLNTKNGMQYISQFKKSEGKDRANLRFVDVNADGRADMVWVDKFSGDGTVWYNEGNTASSGSAFTWNYRDGKPSYLGAGQGACMQFSDLDGNGRADMTITDALTNAAQTWFNRCPGEGTTDNGDDSDTFTSSPLPNL